MDEPSGPWETSLSALELRAGPTSRPCTPTGPLHGLCCAGPRQRLCRLLWAPGMEGCLALPTRTPVPAEDPMCSLPGGPGEKEKPQMASQRSFGLSCSTAQAGGRAEAEGEPARGWGWGVHKGRSAPRSPGQRLAAKKTCLVVSAVGTCIPESLKGRWPRCGGVGGGGPTWSCHKEQALKGVRHIRESAGSMLRADTYRSREPTGRGCGEEVPWRGQARGDCGRHSGQGLHSSPRPPPPPTPVPALPRGGPSVGDEPRATSLGWHHLGGQEVSQGMPGEQPSAGITVPRPALPYSGV